MTEKIDPTETLDCVGLFCPEPLFQTREAVDQLDAGDVLEVLADDPAAEEDLTRFAKRTGHEVLEIETLEDYQRFLIKKGDLGEEPASEGRKRHSLRADHERSERQYSPLVLAQAAKAMDLNPTVYYLGEGLVPLKPGAAEEMQVGTFPTVAQMLQKTIEMGIPILACEASKQMLGWDEVELIDGVKIVGAATLNDLALESGATMWF